MDGMMTKGWKLDLGNLVEVLWIENVRLRRALGYFMNDERFQVAISGNPFAVEKMLAEVRAILSNPTTKE
jgi:hypothetical protein